MTVYDMDIEMTVFEYILHKLQKQNIKSINDIFFQFQYYFVCVHKISVM
jgi:hypothetical protein